VAPPVLGVNGLTVTDMNLELDRRGSFVVFQWAVSRLLISGP
jgi:hypothetical protein